MGRMESGKREGEGLVQLELNWYMPIGINIVRRTSFGLKINTLRREDVNRQKWEFVGCRWGSRNFKTFLSSDFQRIQGIVQWLMAEDSVN